MLRLVITLLALLAFTLQGYVTQTHIHTGAVLTLDGSAKTAQGSQKQHDRIPANQDPANCPVCQQMAQAGHYVTPAAISALAPTTIVSTIFIVLDATILATSASHPWHSRAPPQH